MESQSGHSPDRHESKEFQMSVESSGENEVQDGDEVGRGEGHEIEQEQTRASAGERDKMATFSCSLKF